MSQVVEFKYQIQFLLFWGMFCCVGVNSTFAQTISIDKLMKIRPISIDEHPTTPEENVLFLPMDFSSSKFTVKVENIQIPKNKKVISIHLVYTKYRQIDTFNQPMLNRKRFENLYEAMPQLFESKDIEWRVFEQRKGKNEKEAKKMFHGFVIFIKEPVSAETLSADKALINKILLSYRDSIIEIPEKTVWRKRKRYEETGYYLPNLSSKRDKGIKYNSSSIWFREKEMRLVYDSIPKRKVKARKKKIGIFNGKILKNTNEFDALMNKNFTGNWGVVTDVTGSMAPYSAQVLAYLKYNQILREKGHYAFFNDGNGAPQLIKRIGSSGGIYLSKTNSFDSIYSTLIKCMENGDGGDIPENNIEAILTTLKRWPDIDSILLIADARAPIKDLALLKYVTKPVTILLCGNVNGNIPFDYYTLAKNTGGSILQTDDELTKLKTAKLGDILEVGDRDYKVTERGLVLTDE
jgi:hypothetical protein